LIYYYYTGSHGSGLADETETPLVVWGAGVSGPQLVDSSENDVSPKDWGVHKLRRRDVQQADIAALMSALLALPTPTNNVVSKQ
jgi:phosphatidylinositol glycan class N